MRWLILLLVLLNVVYFIWAGNHPQINSEAIGLDVDLAVNKLDDDIGQANNEAGLQNNAHNDFNNNNINSNDFSKNDFNNNTVQTIELLPTVKIQPPGQGASLAYGNLACEDNIATAADTDAAANTFVNSGSDDEGLDSSFCWYIGLPAGAGANSTPGNSAADIVTALQQRLLAVGIESAVESVKIVEPVRYLVYLPPLASREQALKRLKLLLAEGYDAYIFERGNLQNGISLDWFSQRAGAERALARYRAEGLAAESRRIEAYRSERWLVLSNAENSKIVDRLWRRIKNDWPGLVRQKNYCPGIAPMGDIE